MCIRDSLNRDQLAYFDLATSRQQLAYLTVRAHHAVTVSRLDRRNAPILDALHRSPSFTTGCWTWVYNTAATIRQGAKKCIDATVLKTKLSLNWIAPFKILAVGPTPASDTPDGRPLHQKLLYLDFPSDLPGRNSKCRVSVVRCKPCRNPDDTDDIPKHLSAGISTYVLNSSSTKSPPYHVTLDDVSPPPERFEVQQISGHQLVRGRRGVMAVLYETHWTGLFSPSWEREMDLQDFRPHILRYPSDTPTQHRQINRLYRQMRIGAARCELPGIAVSGRNIPPPGLRPRPAYSLAPTLQLFPPSFVGSHLVQGPQRSLAAGQHRTSRLIGRLFKQHLHRPLPRLSLIHI